MKEKKSRWLARLSNLRQFFNDNPWTGDLLMLTVGYFVGVFYGHYREATNSLLFYLFFKVLFFPAGAPKR